MTELEIRLAVGELDGWIPTEPRGKYKKHMVSHAFVRDGSYYGGLSTLPHYTTSKDALQPLLKALDCDQWLEFMLFICDAVSVHTDRSKWVLCRAMLEATAMQMAEALLRTHGKWTK